MLSSHPRGLTSLSRPSAAPYLSDGEWGRGGRDRGDSRSVGIISSYSSTAGSASPKKALEGRYPAFNIASNCNEEEESHISEAPHSASRFRRLSRTARALRWSCAVFQSARRRSHTYAVLTSRPASQERKDRTALGDFAVNTFMNSSEGERSDFSQNQNSRDSRPWKVFLVTYAVYAIVYITRKSFSVVKSLIQDDLQLSTYTLGTIDSAFLGTYALFQIFLPAISDSAGVRPVLMTALTGAGALSVLFASGWQSSHLLISWFLEGVAHAPIFAVLIKGVSLWFPAQDRARVLGIWTTSQQIGAMIATTLATSISVRYGWRATFVTAGLITIAAAILVFFQLPEPPDAHDTVAASAGSSPMFQSTELVAFSGMKEKASLGNKRSLESGLKDPIHKQDTANPLDILEVGSPKCSLAPSSRRKMSDTNNDLDTSPFELNSEQNPQLPPLQLSALDKSSCNAYVAQNGSSIQEITDEPVSMIYGSEVLDPEIRLRDTADVIITPRRQTKAILAAGPPHNFVQPIETDQCAELSRCSTSKPFNKSDARGDESLSFIKVLQVPNLVACGMAYFCVKLVRYALLFWLPYFLVTEMRFDTALAGYSSMLFDLGGVFGSIASGFVSEKLFKRRKFVSAAVQCILTAISLLLFTIYSAADLPPLARAPSSQAELELHPRPHVLPAPLLDLMPLAVDADKVLAPLNPDMNDTEFISVHNRTDQPAPEIVPPATTFSRPSLFWDSALNGRRSGGPKTADAFSTLDVIGEFRLERPVVRVLQAVNSLSSEESLNHVIHPQMGRWKEGTGIDATTIVQQGGQQGGQQQEGEQMQLDSWNDESVDAEIARLQTRPRPVKFVQMLTLMTLVGFFVAGPDSVLGASSAGEILSRSGLPKADGALSTATGIVNGMGAFGGVAQGYLTAVISQKYGWPALFTILAGGALCCVLFLVKCIVEDVFPRQTDIGSRDKTTVRKGAGPSYVSVPGASVSSITRHVVETVTEIK